MPYLLQRLIAALAFVALSPLVLMTAVAVRVFSGSPILYVADRVGHRKARFPQYKFRTMVPDADKLIEGDLGTVEINRVTKVGAVLRSTSLDELPQLVNVFMGDMALVGPRPLHPSVAERVDDNHVRFSVLPGITGLAQVSGRNTIAWSKRLEFDARYVKSRSLVNDLRILAKTISRVTRRSDIVLDRNTSDVLDI